MLADAFSHVRVWVFDLDNTLYPASARLFDQIELRMTDWVAEALGVGRAEADRLRAEYWQRYGTTLAGLMREHGVDPAPYLTHVHDIDLGGLSTDPALAAMIAALPGRKIVHTNGSRGHAERVTRARGLDGVFDALYGIEEAGFRPKPERHAFETILARDGSDARQAAMFEDDAKNLVEPHALGMRTVHIHDNPSAAPHVHHSHADLAGFLATLGFGAP